MKNLSRYGLILFAGLFLLSTPVQSRGAGSMTPEELALAIDLNGLDAGINSALRAGMSLDDILAVSMSSGSANAQIILVSLCSAGANNTDLRKVAMDQNISPLIFASAMDTCAGSAAPEETQAYTPVRTRVTAQARTLGVNTPPEPYASPSSFGGGAPTAPTSAPISEL